MSSRTKRAPLEALYRTPPWAVRHLTSHLTARLAPALAILDPCSGTGALGAAWLAERPSDTVFEVELVEGRGAPDVCADFLREPLDAYRDAGFDLVILNPSFEIAREFVDASLAVEAPLVASLQRLGSIESRRFDDGTNRRDWIAQHEPELLILPQRLSFSADGRTDSCAYAWFIFGEGARRGRWAVAPLLTLEERRRP